MRILIRENAAEVYRARCMVPPLSGMQYSPEWRAMLEQVQGQWLEVETEHLFADQFNTGPIPGVSERGMRIMLESVAQIEGDVRVGMVKCSWCGGYDRDHDGKCDQCGKTDTLKPLLTKPQLVAP